MCCLKIDTETLLANCLNTCKTYSFSPDDLQQIVRLMANATDRYIFSDTGDDALHESVTKFPDMFVYQTKAGKAHGFNRGMIGRTLELLWEKFQNNFVYIHVFVTTWHLKYDIIDI